MIAIDVMGGDFAPQAQLEGSLRAAKAGIPICLFGPKDKISELLFSMDERWHSYPIEVVEASEVISMAEEPVLAVRKRANSSLVLAVRSVYENKCKAVLSAGNSGALMVAATFILGKINGIERPAVAGFLPSAESSVLCLDLGANTDCKPHFLLQFAHLGKNYLSSIKGIANPKIGLLSNGVESTKGSALVKEAHKLLSESQDLNFIGNIEPEDICNNLVDIVVCDGFSGNILLKTAEGVSDMIFKWVGKKLNIKENQVEKDFAEFLHERTSWEKLGGAVLLGVRGNVIVAHGKANANAIENAIIFAWQTSQSISNSEVVLDSSKTSEISFKQF